MTSDFHKPTYTLTCKTQAHVSGFLSRYRGLARNQVQSSVGDFHWYSKRIGKLPWHPGFCTPWHRDSMETNPTEETVMAEDEMQVDQQTREHVTERFSYVSVSPPSLPSEQRRRVTKLHFSHCTITSQILYTENIKHDSFCNSIKPYLANNLCKWQNGMQSSH